MALPLILAGAAIIAAGVGAKKAIDAAEDNGKAKDLREDAQDIFASAQQSLEVKRKETANKLAKFGKVRLQVWENVMGRFVESFEKLKHVELTGGIRTDQLLSGGFSRDELVQMRELSYRAGEALQDGAVALGAGALAGIASYGGATMFASASTGTAISALSGAAATNATLAWFGGGSLAAGGFGMAGGIAVLGGIVAGPVLAIGGMIMASKAQENLANARRSLAEAKRAAEEMRQAEAVVVAIRKIAVEFHEMTVKVSSKMIFSLQEMEKVIAQSGNDFRTYRLEQKQVVQQTVLFAQTLKALLEMPLLTPEGGINESCRKALIDGKRMLFT